MIYFVERGDTKRIKIGTTIKLSLRLGTLATQYKTALTVLAVKSGGRDEEQALHQKFAHLNVEGEWFESSAELLAYIEAECQPWDGKDEVPVGKIVRVSDELAHLLRVASIFGGISVAEYADIHLLPVAKKLHYDMIVREAEEIAARRGSLVSSEEDDPDA